MKATAKLAIVLIGLLLFGFSTIITASELVVYADKKVSKKNQKIDNKLECEIDIDHNKNSDVGPNNQVCDNDGINLINSTLIQSSPDNGNGDIITPRVLSVEPNDGAQNVSLNTEIKVTFDRTMDQDTLDDGSLQIFNLDGGVDPEVNSDPSAMSVTYTLDRQLEPGTRYEAQLNSNIQDKNGNFLDCSDSNAVDSSCSWQFETTGSSNANIELSPTSGPFGTVVTITGTGFDPNSEVRITFAGTFVITTQTNNNGEFSADFTIPVSIPGPHTVEATDGSSSDQTTFTVTSVTSPAITLTPTTGPAGTSVSVAGIGFDPGSAVTLKFDGDTLATTPSTVTPGSNGGFNATFTVPASSDGSKTVVASQGSKEASKPFTVTSATSPAITLTPTSGPAGTSVSVAGINFDSNSEIIITFDGSPVPTIPANLTTSATGVFSTTFTVPASATGDETVKAIDEEDNSDSAIFTVTGLQTPLSTNQNQTNTNLAASSDVESGNPSTSFQFPF